MTYNDNPSLLLGLGKDVLDNRSPSFGLGRKCTARACSVSFLPSFLEPRLVKASIPGKGACRATGKLPGIGGQERPLPSVPPEGPQERGHDERLGQPTRRRCQRRLPPSV